MKHHTPGKSNGQGHKVVKDVDLNVLEPKNMHTEYKNVLCIDQELKARFTFVGRHIDRQRDRPKTMSLITWSGLGADKIRDACLYEIWFDSKKLNGNGRWQQLTYLAITFRTLLANSFGSAISSSFGVYTGKNWNQMLTKLNYLISYFSLLKSRDSIYIHQYLLVVGSTENIKM